VAPSQDSAQRDPLHAGAQPRLAGLQTPKKRDIGALNPAPDPGNIGVGTRPKRVLSNPRRLAPPPSMIVKVLGCSGAIAAGCKTTAFLLEHDVLIDAGTGVGDLGLEALARIDHILISHSHLDHVLAIALLADSVIRLRQADGRPSIQVHALPETIAALRAHIFNGVIWPDFTRLPDPARPVLEFVPFGVGDALVLGGKHIEVLSASHTVPAVGFGVDGGAAGWWIYTGDTGPNPALWQRLSQLQVAHLVIETAFSDEERLLARLSKHLCPAELGRQLAHLAGAADVHITHIKPGEIDGVMAEIGRLATRHRIRALVAGQTMRLGEPETIRPDACGDASGEVSDDASDEIRPTESSAAFSRAAQ
jgi:ribonuclease BN (tRNA processing enzyme)